MGAIAMAHVGYVVVGWTIPLVLLGAYTLRLLRRGRALAVQVPPERPRWS